MPFFPGVIIEQQKTKGLEILIGGRKDPAFGKIITVGMGGTLVELIKDVSIRVLPVGPEDISAMLFELQAYPLISGYRNEPALDKEALITMISSIARLFVNRDDVVEFDLNPVFLYEKGACVVDARFYVTDEATPPDVLQKAALPPGILNPTSIAVIGASPDSNKVGYAVLRNLLAFPGKLYPVNPRHLLILGQDRVSDTCLNSRSGRYCRDRCSGTVCSRNCQRSREKRNTTGHYHLVGLPRERKSRGAT